MSPRDDVFTCWSHRFPRVSGDEPLEVEEVDHE